MLKNSLSRFLLSYLIAALGTSAAFAIDVVDADTGKPASGVWTVIAREVCSGFGHCNTSCVEVHATKSRGIAELPAPWRRSVRSYNTYVHKQGLYSERDNKNNQYVLSTKPSLWATSLSPDLDRVSIRIRYLAKLASVTSCFGASADDRAELIPFYKNLLDEVWAIAQLPEHKEDARPICWVLYHSSLESPNSYSSPAGDDPRMIAHLEKTEPKCLEKPDFSERDRFFNAVRKHDLITVSGMLSAPIDEARRARRLNPALVTAALSGDAAMMRLLLSHSADPNVISYDPGQDPSLLITILLNSRGLPEIRKLELAELLFSSGADPNKADTYGYTPFQRASRGTQADLVPLMLKYGANINLRVSCKSCLDNRKLPIHLAQNIQVANKLIEAGGDVNSAWGYGTTALHAVSSPEMARFLIEKGADVNAVHNDGWTPLMHVLQIYESFRTSPKLSEKWREIAVLLVQNGARLDIKNGWGVDAFYYTSDDRLKTNLTVMAAARQK